MFSVKQPGDPETTYPPELPGRSDSKNLYDKGHAPATRSHGHTQVLPDLPARMAFLIFMGIAGDSTSAFQTDSGDALIRSPV